MTKSRGILPPRAIWTAEQLEQLRTLYPDMLTADLAKQLGHPLELVYRKASRLGLTKSEAYLASPAACRLRRGDNVGAGTRFAKGHSSWNKGTIGIHTGGEETQFKPGQQPHNTLPIGAYRIDKDGVLQRKISDDKGSASKRWRGVHELVWVAANGPMPPKHIVIFRPGMRTVVLEEITLDKVECISLAENMKRNTRHNLPKELADLCALRGALTRAINKRKENHEPAEIN